MVAYDGSVDVAFFGGAEFDHPRRLEPPNGPIRLAEHPGGGAETGDAQVDRASGGVRVGMRVHREPARSSTRRAFPSRSDARDRAGCGIGARSRRGRRSGGARSPGVCRTSRPLRGSVREPSNPSLCLLSSIRGICTKRLKTHTMYDLCPRAKCEKQCRRAPWCPDVGPRNRIANGLWIRIQQDSLLSPIRGMWKILLKRRFSTTFALGLEVEDSSIRTWWLDDRPES
jgi:hypothetical protein